MGGGGGLVVEQGRRKRGKDLMSEGGVSSSSPHKVCTHQSCQRRRRWLRCHLRCGCQRGGKSPERCMCLCGGGGGGGGGRSALFQIVLLMVRDSVEGYLLRAGSRQSHHGLFDIVLLSSRLEVVSRQPQGYLWSRLNFCMMRLGVFGPHKS